MDFLHQQVFDPILQSLLASEKLKQGARFTIVRMEQRDAVGMIQYYWSAIIGTERSIGFAALLRDEGFERFEEALEEFRVRFDGSGDVSKHTSPNHSRASLNLIVEPDCTCS
jgi:hypothetical protein